MEMRIDSATVPVEAVRADRSTSQGSLSGQVDTGTTKARDGHDGLATATTNGHISPYADAKPGQESQATEHTQLQRDLATDVDHESLDLPLAQRTRTAPEQRSTVPRLQSARQPVTMKRRHTARLNTNRSAPFQYTFDPLSSDSNTSSSSEEDAQHHKCDKDLKSDVGHQEDRASSNRDDRVTKAAERQGHSYSKFAVDNDLFRTRGRVSKRDGRLKISVNETANSGYAAKALGQTLRNHLNIPHLHGEDKSGKPRQAEQKTAAEDRSTNVSSLFGRPHLNIVIMVIGSRGDIQPFLKIAKILQQKHHHRVRLASHPTFRDFVESEGIEFFSVGGDPSELMAFMVKNPGLVPHFSTVRAGEIPRRRAAMAEMFDGFWRACINTTDHEHDSANLKMMGEKKPFIADAIIANPPSMAHVHIAEKLGVPLHIMFTFPYTPTTQFPHPLANIKARKSNVDANYVNFMSYPLVEMMTWQGLGDIVNRFREKTLGLEPVSSLWAPGALYRMKVPYTYLWSPSLVPKPPDWGSEIDIAGFAFLELASDFQPPQDLLAFLAAGPPPVYIGFGSIVVDDPDRFTEMIFDAVSRAGVRALVNKGWGGLGRGNDTTPDNIFMLENTPHDWLFPQVAAVVHHGGAGTTAIGLKLAKPTMIVPFFGDQPFWGARVAEAGAGAHECIPYKRLNAERLAEGIKQCLTAEAQENVQRIADAIAEEGDGAQNAVASFHRCLPLAGRQSLRCSVLPNRVAVWKVRDSTLRLSALAAEVLHREGKLAWQNLKLLRHCEWNDFDGPGEPITGGVASLTESLYGIGEGLGMVPVRIAKHLHRREEHERRKRARERRKRERQKQKAALQHEEEIEDENDTPPTLFASSTAPPTRTVTNLSTVSSISTTTPPLPNDTTDDLTSGLKHATYSLLTLPNHFHVAVAQGFHNAPRLWGDASVRHPVKITGIKSGFRAAGTEFSYGIYDGFADLVKQPYYEWEEHSGVKGKVVAVGTGVAKGVGGFASKEVSAVISPPAFVVKGLFRHWEQRAQGPGTKVFLRRARIVQGQKELHSLRVQQAEASVAACEGKKEEEDEKEPEDQEKDEPELTEIEQRVAQGWKAYQDLWRQVMKSQSKGGGAGGGNILVRAKCHAHHDRHHGDVNLAMEDHYLVDRAT